jgi:hypothetical protein
MVRNADSQLAAVADLAVAVVGVHVAVVRYVLPDT